MNGQTGFEDSLFRIVQPVSCVWMFGISASRDTGRVISRDLEQDNRCSSVNRARIAGMGTGWGAGPGLGLGIAGGGYDLDLLSTPDGGFDGRREAEADSLDDQEA